jgi:hypothetical protein
MFYLSLGYSGLCAVTVVVCRRLRLRSSVFWGGSRNKFVQIYDGANGLLKGANGMGK